MATVAPPTDWRSSDGFELKEYKVENVISGYYGLHETIYISRAEVWSDIDQSHLVRKILEPAIANNLRLNVTGALLVCDGWFLQILEGRPIDVDRIFERVAVDKRHFGIRRLASGPIAARRFSQWAMCASILSPTDEAIVSILKTSGKFDGKALDPIKALQLLQSVSRLQLSAPQQ